MEIPQRNPFRIHSNMWTPKALLVGKDTTGASNFSSTKRGNTIDLLVYNNSH
jgi:hypothetical protein